MTIGGFTGHNRFLSNFYLVPVEVAGLTYPSSEHAYQAMKCALVEDRKAFTDTYMTPAKAKKRGRVVRLRSDWESVKDRVMLEVLQAKFRRPFMAKALLATGDQKLIEVNTWGDKYWGVCGGEGLNRLGETLMQIRSELKCAE